MAKLEQLNGMTAQILHELRAKGKINGLEDFVNATLTPEGREELQKKTELPMFLIYNWAKQADLLRCEQLNHYEADQLCQAGLRGLTDLAMCDAEALTRFLIDEKIAPKVNDTEVLEWIIAAGELQSSFIPNRADRGNPAVLRRRPTQGAKDMVQSFGEAYGSDLADVIAELGKGIAQAQREMDRMSIDVQNQILSDPVLANSGYNANWYVIPEVDFTLKMEYSFTQEKENRRLKMNVVPMNAGYNNLFRSTSQQSAESTLNLKFVPVPPPEAFTRRITMPDLEGMARWEADEILENLGCSANYTVLEGMPKNGTCSEVIRQLLPEGTPMMLGEVVQLIVYEVDEEKYKNWEILARVMQRHLEKARAAEKSAE